MYFFYIEASAHIAILVVINNNNSSNDNDDYHVLSPKFFTHIFSLSIIIFPFKNKFLADSKAALPASTVFLPSHLNDHNLSLELSVLPRHPLPHTHTAFTPVYSCIVA